MKHYYQQLSELRMAEARFETLKEKKKLLEVKATKITSVAKEIVVTGCSQTDKIGEYLIKVEEIDKQIEEVEKELEILKKGLNKMEAILKNVSGLEEKIFRLYYIENKTPLQISYIVPCGIATVYRKIKEIKTKFKDDKI